MSQQRRSVADEPFLVVRSATGDHRDGTVLAEHAHGWHQLVHVTNGLVAVATADGQWLAPPGWAVWMPAGLPHGLRFVGQSALRTLYLAPDWWGADGVEPARRCRTLAVSPLLRELMLATVAAGMLDRRNPRELAMATLIAGEIGPAGPPPFALPEPRSPAIRRAARLIAENASEAASAEHLARAVGLGRRVLERRFRAETGLGPAQWRRHHALLAGMEAVAAGRPIKAAAALAGYSTSSSFIAAFRTTFGATPGRWFGSRIVA